jgi:hypothetical protein
LWPHVIEAIADNTRRAPSEGVKPMGFARALISRPIHVRVKAG